MVAGIVIVLATIVAGYFFVRWQKARQARQAVIDRQVAQGDLTGVKLDIPQPPELDRKKQKLATTRQAWWKGAARKEAPTKRLVEELDDLPNIIDRLLKQNQHFNSAVGNYSRADPNWDRARKAVNELPNPEAQVKHHEWYDTVIKLRLKSRQVARQYYEARESIQPTATPVAEKFRTLEDILRDAADYDLSGLSEETKLAVETAARRATNRARITTTTAVRASAASRRSQLPKLRLYAASSNRSTAGFWSWCASASVFRAWLPNALNLMKN